MTAQIKLPIGFHSLPDPVLFVTTTPLVETQNAGNRRLRPATRSYPPITDKHQLAD